MFQEYEIRELPLSLRSSRQQLERFLSHNGLRLDKLDYYAAIFKDEHLLAGGGFDGKVMKCIAVAEEARELNLTNTLVSHLRTVGYNKGYDNLFVFTKPENETIFTSLAFHTIGRAAHAILLESNPNGIGDYCRRLSDYKRPGRNACIVMNCNPMTHGHRYLIETAAQQADTLHILLVSEDKSEFCFNDRLEMVRQGTADLHNVLVHPGGDYIISSATFPGYFIKSVDEITPTQIELDLNIFTTHIAPALGVDMRFVGSEPFDPLTALYNKSMQATLPAEGIEVIEIERIQQGEEAISASRVRKLLQAYKLREASALVPETTKPFLQKKLAEAIAHTAARALFEELHTTPKPGLVDRNDNGAHTDMDPALMEQSIRVLQPYFAALAYTGITQADLSFRELSSQVRTIGVNAEKAMLQATGGVNTHRGAIFSLGLAIVATTVLIAQGKEPEPRLISETIASLAACFERQTESKGADACRKYGIQGALANAKQGYSKLFEEVIPAYRQLIRSGTDRNTANIKTLLQIISLLDDTNIYHRGGIEIATETKEKAATLYKYFNLEQVREFNTWSIRNNISPGGSADMLALTLFITEIVNTESTN